MKKAVFFDIDGTLWTEKMVIPKSTKGAISALREAGNYAFICSGRSRSNIRTKELLEIGFDGVIAACGTYIECKGEKVFEELLSKEQIEHALSTIKKNGMSVVLEGPRYLYVDEDDFLDDPYVVHLREELGDDVKNITGGEPYEINKMSAVLSGADLMTVSEQLGSAFSVINHGGGLIEIQPSGHTKATGIEKVCRLLGIEHADTYAFGDSANDVEMLAYVAHGIAMGNASQEAKEAAEYVTTDIMQDGILEGLKHYGLI